MLTLKEKHGLENILKILTTPELYNLCDTVTNRMLKYTNSQEAINAIISCVQEPKDILLRKRITMRVLFEYLRTEIEYVSPKASKVELVLKCLELWRESEFQCTKLWKEPDEVVSDNKTVSEVNEIEDVEMCYTEENNQIDTLKGSGDIVVEPWDDKTMAAQFIQWFFPIFNQLNDFSEKHFWQDVKLEMNAGNQIIGDSSVVHALISLIRDHNLYFLPNDSPLSLKCEHEIHGMVKITIHGIVHRFQNPVGTFETVFGLLRNPEYDNNWKIKWLYLNLKVNCI